MKKLKTHVFDLAKAKKELADFKSLLTSNKWLSEAADVLPFFNSRANLSAVIGFDNPYITEVDRIAHEFVIQGDFRCDLVIGQHDKQQFCFVEFEDAKKHSVFTTAGRTTPHYSPRLEHGFSQIVDWFYKLSDMRGSRACEDIFGSREPEYVGLVIVGRSCTLGGPERARFNWRRSKTIVDSHPVYLLTFDDLYDHVNERLNLR